MFIAIRPSTVTTAPTDPTKPIAIQGTIIPNGADIDAMLEAGTLKAGDEIFTISQKRIVEAQPPVKIGDPIDVQ